MPIVRQMRLRRIQTQIVPLKTSRPRNDQPRIIRHRRRRRSSKNRKPNRNPIKSRRSSQSRPQRKRTRIKIGRPRVERGLFINQERRERSLPLPLFLLKHSPVLVQFFMAVLSFENPMSSAPLTSLDFRRALGQFATGVTVVTVESVPGRIHGMTANSFTSVSLDPPLISVCVDQRAHLLPLLQEKRVFGINVLKEE